MNPNIQWLSQRIAPLSRVAMPNETLKETYDFLKDSSDGWTNYEDIQADKDTLEAVALFREKYNKATGDNWSPNSPAQPKPVKTVQPKPEPDVKVKKPKKEKECDCKDKNQANPAPKSNPQSSDKPKTQKKADAKSEVKPASMKKETVKKASVKVAKPKADKKPTASEKATEKAQAELRKIKAENREYENRIMFDSDFLTTLLKQTQQHAQMQKGLGALPTELAQELKKERALNTLYRQVMKRNVKAFKSLEVRLKKNNEVTPAMERKFMELYSTINGLKQSAVAKRQVTLKKKKKGFLARLFS